jgi:potassium channel subfamily K
MEIRRVQKQVQSEADADELAEFIYSICTLLVFWLISALMYHYMEGWTYGDSLYFSYIFFLTVSVSFFHLSYRDGDTRVLTLLLLLPAGRTRE